MNIVKGIDTVSYFMRNFLKHRAAIAVVSSSLALISPNAAIAEDIEIYENLIDNPLATNTLSENKPNVLFILDTSGSMADLTAVGEDRPPYNPNTVYNQASPSPEGIYVYTQGSGSASSLSYTGMYVSSAVNNCKAAVDYHTEFSSLPQFPDQALVWEYTPEVAETTCSAPTPPDVQSRTRIGESAPAFPYGGFFVFDTFSASPGDTFNLEITTVRQLQVRARFRDSSGSTIGGATWPLCNMQVNRNSTVSCASGEVPANASDVQIQVNDLETDPDFYSGPNTETTITYTESESACIPVAGVPASGDWKVLADDLTNLNLRGLECQNDDGFHGPNASSAETFPQYANQGDPAPLDEPKFTTSADATQRVDWSSPLIPSRVLVPANYHDYLQRSAIDLFNQLNGTNETPTVIAAVLPPPVDTTEREQIQIQANEWCLGPNGADGSFVQVTTPSSGADDNIFLCRTRMSVLKESTTNLLNTLTGVNIGIMRFNRNNRNFVADSNGPFLCGSFFNTYRCRAVPINHGGTLVQAVKDIDGGNGTNRTNLIAAVKRLPAEGATPIQESLYEAYSYFAGISRPSRNEDLAVTTDPASTVDIPPATALTLMTSGSQTDSAGVTGPVSGSGNYISPIKNSCQDNNIILFSDGQPTNDTNYTTDIQALPSVSTCVNAVGFYDNGDSIGANGRCLDELAGFMANTTKVNANATGISNKVYTHTIAFGSKIPLLEEASDAALRQGAGSGDQHYDASSASSLTAAFQSIFQNIENVSSDTFVAPAVSVNTFNRLESRSDVYFAVFEPNNSPRWYGNLKRYKLNSDLEILDDNDNLAVDPDNGFFVETARSVWSATPDGANIREGGSAAELNFSGTDGSNDARQLYASLETNQNVVKLTSATFDSLIGRTDTDGDGKVLGDADDLASMGETANPDVATNKENIRDWSLGIDITDELGAGNTEPNFYVGDTLHSTPYVLSFGTSIAQPKDVIFSTTNQGMLHAVDGETGEELWAYLPDVDLLRNLGDYFNDGNGVPHRYGLDSEIAFDVERDSSNQLTKANLFLGQRRGGDKYFAIDVLNARPSGAATPPPTGPTPPTPPSVAAGTPVKKLWTIDSTTLPGLGQTWATPVPAVINYCTSSADTSCAPRDVLVLSGGYDEKYDDEENVDMSPKTLASIASSGVEGNAIYIVDRETGTLLWMVSSSVTDSNHLAIPEMIHSIPAEPAVIDVDFDGVADLIFAVDIAGNVFRIDFQGHAREDSGAVVLDENDIRAVGNNTTAGQKEVNGARIAVLSDPAQNRRFYNRLDVSITPRDTSGSARYNIVTGSGYRSHPLRDETAENNGERNRIYALFDRNLLFPQINVNGSGAFAVGSNNGISYDYDGNSIIMANDISEVSGSSLDLSGDHEFGFFVNLQKGTSEKMLNPTLTDNFRVIAVSYSPTPVVQNIGNNAVCQQDLGSSTAYEIDLRTGDVQSTNLNKSGISPQASIVLISDGNGGTIKGVVIGTEVFGTVEEGSSENLTSDGKFTIDTGAPGALNRVNWLEK